MRRALYLSTLLFLLFSITPPTVLAQDLNPITTPQSDKRKAETMIHLLSYISRDYPNAVQGGKIINDAEYAEQVEFAKHAQKLLAESNIPTKDKAELSTHIENLLTSIKDKNNAEKISTIANSIRDAVIKVAQLQTTPLTWPNLRRGKQLFEATCAVCHGLTGNGKGIASKGLDPQPANFLDDNLMNWVSPYQAYNTIKLGVPGTAMMSYSNMSEEDIWDLAFYVKSLRFKKEADTTSLRKAFDQVFTQINLKEVATLNDQQLLDRLKNNQPQLEALRILMPTAENVKSSLLIAKNKLNTAKDLYAQGKKGLARTAALAAYLEGIEPVEARLKSIDADFVSQIERQMMAVRQAIEKDKGQETLNQEVQKAINLVDQADEMLRSQKLNYWLTFILSWSIVLREGLEAFLILAVVLALIKKMNMKKALPWLHGGWVTAVIAGIAGWFLSDYIIDFGGKNREIMEGLIALFAVVVLLFVGSWLHSNANAKQWQIFIKEKVGKYLDKDRMWGLAAFSFMVVFREAFEVVLFLQAINLEAAPQNKSAIGLGVIAAAVLILIIAIIFLKTSKKIPIRQLFLWSSWIIVLLAIVLIGKGVHALQESGWIAATNISQIFHAEWLGIYPTLESVLAQVGLLVFILITYYLHNRKAAKTEQ